MSTKFYRSNDVLRKRVSVFSSDQVVGYQISKFNIPNVWLETEGEGVTIAVIDTGIQSNHKDLTNAENGFNFHDNKSDATDGNGHGTHVAGIIAATNNDFGIVGVAPKAKVIAVKVLGNDGSGSMDAVIDGINWAIDQGVDIINMSLGASEGSDDLHDACKRAHDANIPVICAAGNDGDIGVLGFPARYDECISIGAIDEDNLRAWFSQTGGRLDFMAPGVDILSTVPVDEYAVFSGTSMATPWSAGVVALMFAKHRKIGGSTPVDTVEDVRDHLKKTSIDLDQAGKDDLTGYGLIDVEGVIDGIESEPVAPVAPLPEGDEGMAYGPVTLSSFLTADVVAPAAPTFFSIEQLSNTLMKCVLTIPMTDSDGSELTGLTKLTLATAAEQDGESPFEGLSMDQILALGGLSVDVELTPADAGTQKEVEIAVVNLGGFQAFGAACSD